MDAKLQDAIFIVTKSQKQNYTIEEWKAYEEATGIKHEYIDGGIYAMSGGTLKHGEILSNVIMTALKKGKRRAKLLK